MPTRTSTPTTEGPVQLKIERLKILEAEIPIVGTSELIVHAWSEKARRMLSGLDENGKPITGPKPKREPRNPLADYETSQYKLEDGTPGFPCVGFKAAIVGACRFFDGIPMTLAKQLIFVQGEGPEQLVRIEGEPHMREDMVRLETKVADIRWRAGYFPWSTTLRIKYNATMLPLDGLLSLVEASGLLGVGEWRPSAPKSATGIYGQYRVARPGE